MEQNRNDNNRKNKVAIIIIILILLLGGVATLSILFSRVLPYTTEDFENVHDLTGDGEGDGSSDKDGANSSSDGSGNGDGQNGTAGSQAPVYHPEFRMEAEAEIFKFSYDETGKVTVIGDVGNTDKLIAPGTTNLYHFTLRNPGDVPMKYTLTMEAYVTGTEEYIPVNARVWDYTNKYLLGSTTDMRDVLELNTVQERATLGAGRYAVYNLEWEWPFEWGDDEHDTMLGNLAVEEDLVLHIVIRTVAEFDENGGNNGLIKPPQTGDDSQVVLLGLLFVLSFVGICAMIVAFFKSNRKEKQAMENRVEKNE